MYSSQVVVMAGSWPFLATPAARGLRRLGISSRKGRSGGAEDVGPLARNCAKATSRMRHSRSSQQPGFHSSWLMVSSDGLSVATSRGRVLTDRILPRPVGLKRLGMANQWRVCGADGTTSTETSARYMPDPACRPVYLRCCQGSAATPCADARSLSGAFSPLKDTPAGPAAASSGQHITSGGRPRTCTRGTPQFRRARPRGPSPML